MAKGKVTVALELALPAPGGGATKQARAYLALRDAILERRVRAGDPLPSTRALAARWQIARGTLESVFERLAVEGYITRKVGAGSRVSAAIPPGAVAKAPAARPQPSAAPPADLTRAAVGVPFVARLANPALLAPRDWARHLQRAMAGLQPAQMCASEPAGALRLREEIAAYLGSHRGIACSPDDLLITNGIRHGIDLLARCLVRPGDRVCVEDPGYPAVRGIFQQAGAVVVPVPIDDQGLHVQRLPEGPGTRMVYVTPAHQAPLGVTMAAGRRLALLEWAQRQGAWIIEDDYDSEFNYHSAPLPALQAIDTAGRVIYCGSFNQSLFSNLRLGYLLAPPAVRHQVLTLWHTVGRSVGVSEQLGLAAFMHSGALVRHLRRSRGEYRRLRDIVVNTLRAEAPAGCRVTGEHAGFHCVLWLPPQVDERMLVEQGLGVGLVLQPLRHACQQVRLPSALVLGFAALAPEQALGAARQLAGLLNDAVARA